MPTRKTSTDKDSLPHELREAFDAQARSMARPDIATLVDRALKVPNPRPQALKMKLYIIAGTVAAAAALALVVPTLILPAALEAKSPRYEPAFIEAIAALTEDALGGERSIETSAGDGSLLYEGWDLLGSSSAWD